MISELEVQKGIAMTTDMWTSAATQGYITLTTYFINDSWELKSQVIATRLMEERHSGQNIATEISKINDEFKISDIICGCLHDNTLV